MEALQLENELGAARSAAAIDDDAEGENNDDERRKDKKREMIIAQARAMDIVLDAKLGLGINTTENGNDDDGNNITAASIILTSHERSIRRQILKEFQSSCAKTIKCANCSGFSPKIRHDQFNKIFQVPLSIRNKRSNITEGVRISSACRTLGIGDDDDDDDEEDKEEAMPDSEDEIDENDQDDDDDDDDGVVDDEAREGMSTTKDTNNKTTKKKQDEFMNTLEIEAQCRLTWEKQSFLCSKFFGSAHAPDIIGSRSSNTR